MDKFVQHPKGLKRLFISHLLAGTVIATTMFAGLLHAAGEVTEIQTIDQPGTPSQYTIDGETFSWGMGTNQVMEGFTSDSQQFRFAGTADRVEIIRHDVENVSTGNPCGVFVERLSASYQVLKANYPSDGTDTGNCDMAAMLTSRIVNRGALDLFSNIGPNPKNVERVDFFFDHGVLAPLTHAALKQSGHVVAEKRGNNPLQIAAITKLDVFGQPAAYGPLVFINRFGCSGESICYGVTNLRHNYSFFQNNSKVPQGYPSYLKDSTESVGMAFISLENLGVSAGDVYYGFSYFADDVDEKIHTLTDVTTFPQDTDDEKILFGDGPDIYGGVAGYFLGDTLSVASGAVFKDENGDGVVDENEAGISDIGLTLYQDTNGDGVFDPDNDKQLGPTFNSDINGEFRIPGLDDGVYFLLLDEMDGDLPPSISVAPGSNPAMILINGNDADGVNFGFVSDTGPSEGGNTGGADAGNADAGSNDAGADAGNADAGGNTDAGGDDAGADAGNADAGGDDAGADDAGADAGNVDAGGDDAGADAGNVDAGGDDAGADAGNVDAGGNDAGADAGNVDAGGDDAGADAGNVDAGGDDAGADAGNVDAGGDDAGSDAGNADAGGDDAGADAGNADAGADGGATDNGNTDSIIINDGDDATVANPDYASVTQGSTVSIDVLANDTDASGLGLMVVSASESPNGTVVVQGDIITYTPEFGFTGVDTFLYVIEDGADTQSTGTISVKVLHFSDINNNGLNDFDECECDNLTLEVGVKGTALGAASTMTLFLLALLFGFRRHVCQNRDDVCGVLK